MAKPSSTALEAIVRNNVKRLIEKHYDGKPGRMFNKNKGSVNLRGIQSFLDGGNCYLSSLQPWADALHVKPYHLLVKDLNVDDLPEVVEAAKLRKLQKIHKAIAEEES